MIASETAPSFRRADAERNAQNIVEAATRLLSDDPHAGMGAIAEAAGVTRVTVNRHFQTREKLVTAVYERSLQHATQVLDECKLHEGSASEALERLVRGWLGERTHLPVQILEQGRANLPPEARAHYHQRALGGPLRALLERGKRTGEFADLPTEWLARHFGATYRAALEAIDAGALKPAEAPDIVVKTLMQGLRG